jgi:small nuclear ribonucleoprotein (snRNP)-like protein
MSTPIEVVDKLKKQTVRVHMAKDVDVTGRLE